MHYYTKYISLTCTMLLLVPCSTASAPIVPLPTSVVRKLDTWERQTVVVGQNSISEQNIEKKSEIKSSRDFISSEEWVKYLEDQPATISIDWLNNKSSEFSRNSTKLLTNGKREEGLHQSIIASTINEYIITLVGDINNAKYNAMRSAQKDNRAALLSVGIDPLIFATSLANLKAVLPAAKLAAPKLVNLNEIRVTKGTEKERQSLMQAVKKGLIDPDSAKFQDFSIIDGNMACVTVNSRNRFGGYAGNTTVFLRKESGSWLFLVDAKSPYVCSQAAVSTLEGK